jgi:hypothetical protein
MPGIVSLTPSITGRDPSASQKTTITSPSIPETLESEGHYISSKKPHHLAPDSPQAQKSSKLRLAKPLSEKARDSLTNKTKKLIVRRNTLDREILRAVEKPNPSVNDRLLQDELLQRYERLEKKELRHLGKCTRKLAELERLYRCDPSSDRAYDYDLVRALLWRFKRNLGPLLDEYANHRSEEDNDDGKMNSLGIDSGSESKSEWSDALDKIDEELQQGTVATNSYSHDKQRTPTQADSCLQNTVTTKDSINETPQSVPTNVGKRKRKEEPAEDTPTKKVRFGLGEYTSDTTSLQKSKIKKRKRSKDKNDKHASVQGEAQTNGK